MAEPGTVLSAGNFAAAVLEQAGYVAQSLILRDFRDFFREAGAFVYILGAIGGIVSVVVFGSFRAARYLLIGPALYWFLVGPTTTFDGVKWQIGSGTPRGLNEKTGEAQSLGDVMRTLQDSKLASGNQMNVATGFALFVRPINGIVNGLSDVILGDDEDKEYLLFLGKESALAYLLQVQPDDAMFTEMLESDFVRQCAEMFGYGVARSAFQFRDDVLQEMGDGKDNAEKRRQFYEGKFKSYRDGMRLNPGMVTQRYLSTVQGVQPSDVPESISCGDMWKVVASYITDISVEKTNQIIQLARGQGGDPDLACRRIMEKLDEDDGQGGGACNLQNVVALYMFKNAVLDRRSISRFVTRLTNSTADMKGVSNRAVVPLSTDLSNEVLESARTFAETVNSREGLMGLSTDVEERFGMTPLQLYTIGAGLKIADEQKDPKEAQRIKEEFISVARLSAIGGPLDAGFLDYPKYHLKNLRQQLFTFAMHLPYWQGVLLYILAVAYPFMSLLVLLPGRAQGFLHLPMAWLWVKSWDIGFAVVMVFERVLWNVLPSLKLSKDVIEQPLGNNDLWQVLSEARKFDHTWNLHMYYVCLAMATLSIPAITGIATLRARRAVLSSFTDKLASDAKEAGGLAAGAHGMRVMADRVRMIGEVQAMAYRAVSNQGEGYSAKGRGDTAHFFGMVGAASSLAGKLPGFAGKLDTSRGPAGQDRSKARAELPGDVIRNAGAAFSEYKSTYAEMEQRQVKADRAYHATFHPIFGRYGELSRMNEAYAAAMDGSGGFELNKLPLNAIDDFISAQVDKTDKMYTYAGRFLGAGAGLLTSSGPLTPRLAGAAALGVPARLALGDPLAITEAPAALQAAAQQYGIDEFVGAFQQQARQLNASGLPVGGIDEAQIRPLQYDERFLAKTFGLTDQALRGIAEQRSYPPGVDPFRREYTYDIEETLAKLPPYVADLIRRNPTPEYGLPFSGKEDGAYMFQDFDPTWRVQDPMESYKRQYPGIAVPPSSDTGAAPPAAPPPAAGGAGPVSFNTEGGDGSPLLGQAPAGGGGASLASNVQAAPTMLAPEPQPTAGGAPPAVDFFRPVNMTSAPLFASAPPASLQPAGGAAPPPPLPGTISADIAWANQGETSRPQAGIDFKPTDGRFLNLTRSSDSKGMFADNLDWLTGDTDELQDNERKRLRLSPPSSRKLT
jgi:hypothetical protein